MRDIIILLGIPGSGKGTQAEKIAEKYNYEHISSGDILRNLDKDILSEEEYEEIKSKLAEGEVVPDKYIYKLVFPKIQQALEKREGVILDGAIRTLEQAKGYNSFFNSHNLQEEVLPIYIEVPEEEAKERLLKRAEESESARVDDKKETIEKRMEDQGVEALQPILDYYKKMGTLQTVDGSGTVEEVESNIEDVLEY